ncbi:MAG: hypothetical protein ACE366_29175 [Bradymonadia bacterium]
MTLEEAFTTLGLSPNSSARAAREAYLTRLRAHRPESDPVGFARLRAAFDKVKSAQKTHPKTPTRPAPNTPQPWLVDVLPYLPPEIAVRVCSLPPLHGAIVASEALMAEAHYALALLLVERCLVPRYGVSVSWSVPTSIMRLICQCWRDDRREEARAMTDMLQRWLDANGLEARVCTGEIAVQWAIIRELRSLEDEWSRVLGRGIASRVLSGAPEQVADIAFAEDEPCPQARARAWQVVSARAPIIACIWGDALKSACRRPMLGSTRRALLLTGIGIMLWAGAQLWMPHRRTIERTQGAGVPQCSLGASESQCERGAHGWADHRHRSGHDLQRRRPHDP